MTKPAVAVFGSSSVVPGSTAWQVAEHLGQSLAEHGFVVVNGGYCGTMEATAKGARAVDGGEARGITVPSLFPDRVADGNKYLTEEYKATSLVDRLEKLIEPEYFVILPGTVGTLLELCLIWNTATIGLLSPAGRRPLILAFRQPWEKFISSTHEILSLPQTHVDVVKFVDGVDDVIAALQEARAQ
eukprot:GILJ01001064.1.p1 GENE.GILJ01001064.1~~GILJ01001064.1.p1  ORF type:complete len:186 (-),score=24.56 GILJ01001064.1:29-586(-)